MKNLYFIILVFAAAHSFAQSSGITYQAIIYNPSGEAIPGVNNASLPMANKNNTNSTKRSLNQRSLNQRNQRSLKQTQQTQPIFESIPMKGGNPTVPKYL